MSFVLGLDAGGSKTIAAIADPTGTVLRRFEGPSLDPHHVSDWQSLLAGAIAEVCGGETPEAAVLGLPMHGEIVSLSQEQQRVADTLLPCPHLVLNDVEVAYDGAFTCKSGVLLLAGTGSMAWAKAGATSLRVGGWGDAFGDEGSAFWIGRQALSLASQALDGRSRAHDFAQGILSACGCTAETLIDWAYAQQNSRAGVGGLARHVDAMADSGDASAVQLLIGAAELLAAHVEAARFRLADPTLAWSHAGSVFGSRTITHHLETLLGASSTPKLPPAGGAIWRAGTLAGWPIEDRFAPTVSACLQP